jgi:tetratricopeptide (TPR) repeat protein
MRLPRVVLKFCVMIILAATIVPSAPAGGTNDARVTGLRLYESGQFADAIPFFDQVLASHNRDLEILVKRGSCYLRMNHPLKALDDFDRVNQYGAWSSRVFGPNGIISTGSTWITSPIPDFYVPESWGHRGVALLMLGRNEEALESFRTSTYLWGVPGNQPWNVGQGDRARLLRSKAGAYEGFGQAYFRLGQTEQAFQVYSQAIAIDPSDANAFAGRADVLATLKLLDSADKDYTEAIRLDSTHSRALCGRGIVRSDQGHDELALADFDRAIELDPKYARSYSYRSVVYARRGQNEKALDDCDALIRLLPESPGPYKDRGAILVRMKRFERALEDLNEAIRLDPKRAASYQNRGAAFNGLGQYERAIDDLSRAIELNPENAGAHTNRGLAQFAVGQYDQAVADLSRAIQLAPQNAVPYFNRAEVFARLGLRDRALQDYDATIRLDPRIAAAYAASARLREHDGERDHAIHDYDMALQLDPKEVGLYYDRGNARRESGDWRGALADYDRAVVLAPQRADAYVARGWSRLSAGVDGADYDARVYLQLKGWHDGLSPYMAILAVLGARQAGRPDDAERVIDEALANLSPRAWPVPVLRYLRGQLTETALLQAAVSTRQEAEAHAFLGFDSLRAGNPASATLHLTWARDHGTVGSIAADVARAALDRLGPSPP